MTTTTNVKKSAIDFGQIVIDYMNGEVYQNGILMKNPKFTVKYTTRELEDKWLGYTKKKGSPTYFDTFEETFKTIFNRALISEHVAYEVYVIDKNGKNQSNCAVCSFERYEDPIKLKMYINPLHTNRQLFSNNYQEESITIHTFPNRRISLDADNKKAYRIAYAFQLLIPNERKQPKRKPVTKKNPTTKNTIDVAKEKVDKALIKECKKMETVLRGYNIKKVEYTATISNKERYDITKVIVNAYKNLHTFMKSSKLREYDFVLNALKLKSRMKVYGTYSYTYNTISLKVLDTVNDVESTLYHEFGHHIYYTIYNQSQLKDTRHYRKNTTSREWNLIDELITVIRRYPTVKAIREKLKAKQNSKYSITRERYLLEGTEIFARLFETYFCKKQNIPFLKASTHGEYWNFSDEEIQVFEQYLFKILNIA